MISQATRPTSAVEPTEENEEISDLLEQDNGKSKPDGKGTEEVYIVHCSSCALRNFNDLQKQSLQLLGFQSA